LVSEFNAAIKTIQIAGQILRNFGGRLDGPDKLRLTDACYSLGLRLMKLIYSSFEEIESDLIGAAQRTLQERYPDLPPADAQRFANSLVFGLLKFTTIGLIKHVSNSIGLEKLAPVFAEVLKIKPTVARRMIDLSIRLDHFTAIPEDQTLQLYKEVQNSLLISDVLRQLIFSRFYFFTAPHDVKQRICHKLEIKIQPILLNSDPKKNL
jgi:hypothetical protein